MTMSGLMIPDDRFRVLMGHALGAQQQGEQDGGESHGYEACGLLGTLAWDRKDVDETMAAALGPGWSYVEMLYLGNNVAEDPTSSYALAPKQQFEMEQAIEQRGETLAVYHSHAKSGANFSATDIELAQSRTEATYVVLGCEPDGSGDVVVRGGRTIEVAAYRLDPEPLERETVAGGGVVLTGDANGTSGELRRIPVVIGPARG